MSNSKDIASTIVGNCLAMRIRLIERVVCAVYSKRLSEHGVTIAQVTLLAAIVRNPGIRAVDLSKGLVLERSTLSRNLRKLYDLGLVENRDGQGRGKELHALAAGEALLALVMPAWVEAQAESERLLGEDSHTIRELAARFTS